MYGDENVIASDVRQPPSDLFESGPFNYLDVLETTQLCRMVVEENVHTIIHLAAILSATGEKYPQLALKINNEGTHNVLEIARKNRLKVFTPSTIAVFGPGTPDYTPEDCVMRPVTMYGITKVHSELLGEYYYRHYGVDWRCLRYPGVISAKTMPGGGTTDYAVEVYYEAVKGNEYRCFLGEDTLLPMIYMDDLLNGTIEFINADPNKLSRRTYNLGEIYLQTTMTLTSLEKSNSSINGIGAMSFTPRELAETIKGEGYNINMTYQPDFRQAIAETWPRQIDFSLASKDWGWTPGYDIVSMTKEMMALIS